MGNVGASSKPIQDPKFDLQMDSPIEIKQKKPLENPGTMEELHKRCKGEHCFIQIHSVCAGFFTQSWNRSIPTYKWFNVSNVFTFQTWCQCTSRERSWWWIKDWATTFRCRIRLICVQRHRAAIDSEPPTSVRSSSDPLKPFRWSWATLIRLVIWMPTSFISFHQIFDANSHRKWVSMLLCMFFVLSIRSLFPF